MSADVEFAVERAKGLLETARFELGFTAMSSIERAELWARIAKVQKMIDTVEASE